MRNKDAKRKYVGLVGNPNSGKTLIFNNLTGGHQHVGNWPGVTVEKKMGHSRSSHDTFFVDLPGTYSLSPYTQEEVVTREYLLNGDPDLVLDIVDASNLERNLYLTTQILETGKKTIVVLNMMDVAKENGMKIDTEKLSEILGVPVIQSVATKKRETHKALDEALYLAGIDHISIHKGKKKSVFCGDCNSCDTDEADACEKLDNISLANKENIIEKKFLKNVFSNETEIVLSKIEKLIEPYVGKEKSRYYSIKVLEKDNLSVAEIDIKEEEKIKLEHIVIEFEEAQNEDSSEIIATERYKCAEKIAKQVVQKLPQTKKSMTEKIDNIVTNKWLAFPIFIAVMFAIYYIAISSIGGILTGWVNDYVFGDWVPTFVSAGLDSLKAPEWLHGLVVDGIVGGVGGVLGFVPQIMVLFFLLSFLEDFGYMARIAFILDCIFRRLGLSGKSIIPIMIGTGCGVPGIMASKTIENEADRKITIMTTTFIPCSAKIPVIALIAGAFFGNAFWVAGVAYFLGVFSIIISAVALKKTRIFRKDVSPFVMELPQYHIPAFKSLCVHMWEKGKMFIKRAGTIILGACVLIWFLSSFDFSLHMVDTNDSMLAFLGDKIAIIFAPLGWGDWQAAAAAVTGLIAKENIVGTMGVLYGNIAEASETGTEIWGTLRAAYTPLAGFSFLAFNLLCAPCFAAIGTIYKEMNSLRWTLFAVGYQCFYAWAVALVIYQLGLLFSGAATFSTWTAIAFLLIAWMIFALFRRQPKADLGFGLHRHT
ncbi:MAG: ferrous iron transport protein B [Clostridiales Family XIII bacterium]|jgi:ferrous iron transport protein B|nr:ferrous iron transport protein B [Clostridiales Family XIII bacterium]